MRHEAHLDNSLIILIINILSHGSYFFPKVKMMVFQMSCFGYLSFSPFINHLQ